MISNNMIILNVESSYQQIELKRVTDIFNTDPSVPV